MRFHDLRHTHAAWLIAQGEHPKTIQSRLGHASISTTLDRYGHLMPGMDEAAADRLGASIKHSGSTELRRPSRRFAPKREKSPVLTGDFGVWALQGSNLRPLPCEGSALPLS